MSRYNQVLDSLQNLRHDDNIIEFGSDCSMFPSIPENPATRAAADAVQDHEAGLAANSDSRPPTISGSDAHSENNGTYAEEESTSHPMVFLINGFTPNRGTTYVYKITAPAPTLTLPPTYPFRTTPDGYPIFRPRPFTYRATLSTAPGYTDPRITAFIAHWTKIYSENGLDPVTGENGMTDLRLACDMRGLAKYGVLDLVVERLVDRALRDADRGWCEVQTNVGTVQMRKAPHAPGLVGGKWEEVGDQWWWGFN